MWRIIDFLNIPVLSLLSHLFLTWKVECCFFLSSMLIHQTESVYAYDWMVPLILGVSIFYVFIKFWLCWVIIAAHQLLSGYSEQGLLFTVLHRLLTALALLLQSTGSGHAGFSSCGSWVH